MVLVYTIIRHLAGDEINKIFVDQLDTDFNELPETRTPFIIFLTIHWVSFKSE